MLKQHFALARPHLLLPVAVCRCCCKQGVLDGQCCFIHLLFRQQLDTGGRNDVGQSLAMQQTGNNLKLAAVHVAPR